MHYLIDTNLLLRIANHRDASHKVAAHAVNALVLRGDSMCITAQNLIEFRAVATRPTSANGLGFTELESDQYSDRFEMAFFLLPDSVGILNAWKQIVRSTIVLGKQCHDARLVAVCHEYGIDGILTFNMRHFTRFVHIPPGLIVLDPSTL